MTAIPMNFDKVTRAFSKVVQVVHCVGKHVDGVWEEEQIGEPEPLRAIVLALTIEQLEFYSDGNSSSGGISVTTDKELFYSDVNEEGLEHRQDYVLYKGFKFKVRGTGFMMGNTNKHIYHCVRHFNMSDVIQLTPQMVNVLLKDYFDSFFGWDPEPNRVLVETQAGTRPPKGLYITLWWRNIEVMRQDPGGTFSCSPDTGPIESLINLSLCEVQVTFRGPSALESAVNARLSLGSSARAFDLWKLLGYSGTSGIQDLSAYYNGAIQPRSYFNFYFYALFNREHPADLLSINRSGMLTALKSQSLERSRYARSQLR